VDVAELVVTFLGESTEPERVIFTGLSGAEGLEIVRDKELRFGFSSDCRLSFVLDDILFAVDSQIKMLPKIT